MTGLAEQVQTVLGASYRVEREIARGSASRLLLATDVSLDRLVVVKVLPLELVGEGVRAERFRREITVSAHLQHPNILPVLAAGATDELLYYVMPYVEGESVRHRLARDGRLPVADAVRILREVADALAFAHAHHVVHRDVKPENILLQGEHAVLADFGIARALAASHSTVRLTESGTMLGTRGYMPPEQVLGLTPADPRTDVYSAGVVGYEMLTGELPPLPLSSGAATSPMPPDTPPAVRAAIVRALEIDPELRFPSAREFRDALSGAPTPSAWRGRGARRVPPAKALALVAVAAVAAVAAYLVVRAPSTVLAELDPYRVVVAPYDVLGGRPDDELGVWREGMVDVLARSLDGLGPLRTVSPTTVVRRWRGRADPDAAEELARSTGAGVAVFGTLIAAGADSVRMRTTVLDAREHRVLDESEWRDVRARVDRLADSAAAAVVRHLAQTRPIGAVRLREARWHVTPALRPFLQGEQYYRRAALDSARVAYERAVALDSTFALAHHRLRSVLRWLSHETDATSFGYALRAGELNHGLGTRDSLLLVADSVRAALDGTPSYTPGWWALARRRAAAIELAVGRYPEDPEVRYEQGEVGYHYGGDLGVRDARALSAFEQAIALDSMFAPAYLHAIELSAALGHVAQARRYLDAYLRQSPHDASVRLVARLMESGPAPPDSADAADATVETLPREAMFLAAYLTRRWADSAETAIRLYRQLAADRPSGTGAEFDDRTRGRAFLIAMLAYRGHVRAAFATANGKFAEQNPPEFTQLALARLVSPDTSDAVFGRWAREDDAIKVVLSLPWWAQRADTAMLASLSERLAAPPRRATHQELGVRAYGAHVARAYLALARRDSVSALRAIADAPDSLCGWRCVPDRLFRARILADRGRLREAVALLDRRPLPPEVTSVTELFWRVERARLAAAQGDDAQAAREHALVSGLWQRGDPALRRYLAVAVNPARDALGGDPP